MSFTRQRSGRSDWARRQLVSQPEALESRQLLATGMGGTYLFPWLPTDQLVTNPKTHQREVYLATEAINPNNPNSPGLSNEGKVVTGIDREGDKWVITVHGPGKVIVTDTTPNDGVLGDDINTIQLIGTNSKTSYVTGNVIASNTIPANFNGSNPPPSNGTILFNQLIDFSGVKSIELNGFDLSDQVTPAVTSNTGVFLYGGVGVLSFDSINQLQNISVNTTPYQIVIGDPNTPLKGQPSIFLNNVNNLSFNSATQNAPSTTPLTTPSVEFMINGVVRNFDIVSAGQGPVPLGAGFQVQFTPIGTTGRTSVQATGIDNLNVHGSAKNFTVSRSPVPFSSESSGINFLHKATFGGNADGVGIDVKGKIGKITFKRGLGNPNGVYTSQQSNGGLLLPSTIDGTPKPSTGYPAGGFLGGQINAKSIKKLNVGQANVQVQTAQNPNYVQLEEQGFPTYVTSTGNALTNALILTSGSIGQANVSGISLNTEIKTGFDLTSFNAGLEGTRNPSAIQDARVKGDLTNTDVSATFRPANNHYDRKTGIAGPGKISGNFAGKKIDTGGKTGLGNTGAGFFARVIKRIK